MIALATCPQIRVGPPPKGTRDCPLVLKVVLVVCLPGIG